MNLEPELFKSVCSDRRCQTVFYFTRSNPFVECFGCGQKMVPNFFEEVPKWDMRDVPISFIRQGKMSKLHPNRGTEMTKVLGLSNYYCKMLSPFLTRYGMDKASGKAKLLKEMNKGDLLDCSLFGDRAFLIEPEHIDIPGFGRDTTGSMIYLHETLQRIKLSNDGEERLLPIHADGDGHCLVHAISRALVGRELFWHPLRSCLKDFIESNLDKFKEMFQCYDFEWPVIIEECDPEYKPPEGVFHGLSNIHIFGLANILRRPIILLDSYECMKKSGDYAALFLPVLIDPERCKGKDNTLNKPICIAWSSNSHNHYIPLVGVDKMPSPVIPKSLLPGVFGNDLSDIESYIQFDEKDNCTIGGNRVLSDSYIQQLVSAMEGQFFIKHGVHPSIVADTKLFLCSDIGVAINNIQLPAVIQKALAGVTDKCFYRCTTCKALIEINNYKRSFYDGPSSKAEECSFCHGSAHKLRPDGSLIGHISLEQKVIPPKPREKSLEGETENLPKMLTLKIIKSNTVAEDVIPDCQLVKEEALEGAILHIASNFIKKHFPEDENNSEFLTHVCDEILKKIGKTIPVPSTSEVMLPSDEIKIPEEEKAMDATPVAEPNNFNAEPSTSELQVIKIVSPNGVQTNLNLNDQVMTYSHLQECILKEFEIPIENQRIKVGFPPKELEAPHTNVNQALPLKHGDRLMVENCSRQENKSRNTPYIRNPGRDSQTNVSSVLKNEMIWSIAKLNPEQFCKGGFVYEEIARNKILMDMVHLFIETFPNKTFAYNYTCDCIELCVKPLGHFIISADLDSRIEQVQEGESVNGYRKCPVMSLRTGHKDPASSRSMKKNVGTNAQTSSENLPAPLVRKGPGFSVLTSPESSERMDLT